MAEGIEAALVTLVCYGLVDWVYKRASAAGVAAHQILMTQAFFFLPMIYAYGLITDTLVLSAAFVWGNAAGVFIFVAMYFFNRSLAKGAVSVMAPIFRLSFAVTAAVAVWLFDEALSVRKVAGLGCALCTVWLLLGSGGTTPAAKAARLGAGGLVEIGVATAAMATVSLIYKLGAVSGGSPATVLAGQASVFAPLATAFSCLRDRGLRVPRVAWSHAAVTAILLFCGSAMLVRGLARGDASVLVPVAQLSFVVTALIGVTVLREPVTGRKLTGLAAAVAALLLLAHG